MTSPSLNDSRFDLLSSWPSQGSKESTVKSPNRWSRQRPFRMSHEIPTYFSLKKRAYVSQDCICVCVHVHVCVHDMCVCICTYRWVHAVRVCFCLCVRVCMSLFFAFGPVPVSVSASLSVPVSVCACIWVEVSQIYIICIFIHSQCIHPAHAFAIDGSPNSNLIPTLVWSLQRNRLVTHTSQNNAGVGIPRRWGMTSGCPGDWGHVNVPRFQHVHSK